MIKFLKWLFSIKDKPKHIPGAYAHYRNLFLYHSQRHDQVGMENANEKMKDIESRAGLKTADMDIIERLMVLKGVRKNGT